MSWFSKPKPEAQPPKPAEHVHKWVDLGLHRGNGRYYRECLGCQTIQHSPVPFKILEKK